jgi:hypothetical protein
MNASDVLRKIGSILLLFTPTAAFSADAAAPKIGAMQWEQAETVCEAWPQGVLAKDARASGLSWIGFPAAIKPFGMRGYMMIDGIVHPLRQIAYAKPDGTLSIYYRTLGDRHFDVYITLIGFAPNALTGANLTGTLVASRFGLFSEIKIAAFCGGDAP